MEATAIILLINWSDLISSIKLDEKLVLLFHTPIYDPHKWQEKVLVYPWICSEAVVLPCDFKNEITSMFCVREILDFSSSKNTMFVLY